MPFHLLVQTEDRELRLDLSLVDQMVKESVCNARDPGLIPALGRTPGEGNGYPFQDSCLGNPWTEENRKDKDGKQLPVIT